MPTTGKRRGGLVKQIRVIAKRREQRLLKPGSAPVCYRLTPTRKGKQWEYSLHESLRTLWTITDNHGQSRTIADMTLTELAK